MEPGVSTRLISYGRLIKSHGLRTDNTDELIQECWQKQERIWHLGRTRPRWQDKTKAQTIHVDRQGILHYIMVIGLLKRSSNVDLVSLWRDYRPVMVQQLQTPWSRLRLPKLAIPQLVMKSPVFYETQMFITAFTNARHLSYPEQDQSSPCPHLIP